ncbi:tensin-4 [Latimeria chalumnae]|uniref:tensin-4 n=1 Tax=Latimeria chalumnae TaxID=7897 RepID=UPI0003C112DD|nr:PREDICTED: tensin-4 [Latimeria chalumnae]|eukprot:XP_006000594.1 PREDICTED: tensin-4 [Latimeria chalumnae]
MSQVIPSHVLRVGQSICLSSNTQEIPLDRGLHPMAPSGCLSSEDCYYCAERWATQPFMVPTHTRCHSPHSGVLYCMDRSPFCVPSTPYPKSPAFDTTSCCPESGFPTASEKGEAMGQSQAGPEGVINQEDLPVSPTLDVSIENLNQLILELDPTFKPISTGNDTLKKGSSQHTSPTNSTGNYSPASTYSSDVEPNYVEMAPAQGLPHQLFQHSVGPTLSTASKSKSVYVSPSVQDSSPTNKNLMLSGSPKSEAHLTQQVFHNQNWGDHHAPSTLTPSEGPLIPQHAQKDRVSSGSSCLASSSPGSENILRTLHLQRAQRRPSGVSILSTSPGSDTSYILGSCHSLLGDDVDGFERKSYRSAGSPFGSTWSFASLNSPNLISPGPQKIYFSDQGPDAFGHQVGTTLHQTPSAPAAKSVPTVSLHHTKGHANSCPPSVNNSIADIPILLVNGSSGYKMASTVSKNHRASAEDSINPLSAFFGESIKKSQSSSISSLEGPCMDGQPTMKFVMDTSKYWFKPSITREQAIELLKDKEAGLFIVRDSTSHRGAFGLAMKVLTSPFANSQGNKTGNDSSELVRHYLIESTTKGVRLKGSSEEPYFGSLSALVYQHAITPLALSCKLTIPKQDFTADEESSPNSTLRNPASQTKKLAVCNVFYLSSVSMETLTGQSAIQKAVSSTFEMDPLPTPTIVHFKVTDQGITLTDVQRKLFFRRHYPIDTLSFCGMDPESRKWQKQCRSARIFGFVAKSQKDKMENICHLFAEYDVVQPASPAIELLGSLLEGSENMRSL